MSDVESAPAEPEPEKKGFSFPSTMTVLVIVTFLVWIAAFLIPSGTYQHDENGVPQPGSFQQIDSPQDFGERVGDFFLAPVNGFYGLQNPETGVVHPFGIGRLFGAVGVFAFVLAIGAFMTMVLATGALDVAIGRLAYAVRGRPWLVIVAVMALFSLLGTTMGWADETLGFYALLIPLMLTLGYDRMTVAGAIIASATVGAMASTVNPFSIGVASEFADVGIGDGIGLRWIGWFVLTAIAIAYVVRYAERAKANPDRSLVGFLPEDQELVQKEESASHLVLTGRQKIILAITAFTFVLLQTIDTILSWMEDAVSGTDSVVFIGLVALINTGIAFVIPSSSGHATLAMPLLAPLGDFADVSRPLVVTAWSWGAGVARFITPTSAVVMAGIALAGVRYDKWIRFMLPLMGILLVASLVMLGIAAALE